MTPQQLTIVATLATDISQQRPDMRAGQAHWAALDRVYPDLAMRLSNTDADCFHDDACIPTFWAALIRETP